LSQRDRDEARIPPRLLVEIGVTEGRELALCQRFEPDDGGWRQPAQRITVRDLVAAKAPTTSDGKRGASALDVGKRAQRARVGPLKIVEQEHQRSVSFDEPDERLQRVNLRERSVVIVDSQLGEDLPERRQRSGFGQEVVERLANRRGERDVRQVALELEQVERPIRVPGSDEASSWRRRDCRSRPRLPPAPARRSPRAPGG
jgi:hypothetical protein